MSSLLPPYHRYVKALRKPLWERTCLFEAGVGRHVNGNMFALLRELCTNPAYADYEPVVSVTKSALGEAREQLATYGLDRVRLVIMESDEYNECLARAKCLLNDDTFPAYFTKRPEQVYLNTWHGTPLKRLGLSDIRNTLRTFANVQKNLLTADFLLFPNEFTRDVFMEDYDLAPFFAGASVLCDYPRNDVLMNPEIYQRVRETEGIPATQQVIAYMPTWRGTGQNADGTEQVETIRALLHEIDGQLLSDQTLYVNLHFLVQSALDFGGFRHIRPFPTRWETYDFLAGCDALVTDYSSVMFDFAVTGRPIYLLTYDEYAYMKDKGTYFPYRSLPFPIVATVGELVQVLGTQMDTEAYEVFRQRFCPYATGDASRRVLGLVIEGAREGLDLTAHEPDPLDEALYVYSLGKRKVRQALLPELLDQANGNRVLVTTASYSAGNIEAFEQLRGKAHLLVVVRRHVQTFGEKLLFGLARRSAVLAELLEHPLRGYFAREAGQMLSNVDIRSLRMPAPDGSYLMWMAKGAPIELVAERRIPPLVGKKSQHLARICAAHGYAIAPVKAKGVPVVAEQDQGPMPAMTQEAIPDPRQASAPKASFRFALDKPRFKNKHDQLTLTSTVVIKSSFPIALDELRIHAGEHPLKATLQAQYPPTEKREQHRCKLSLAIDYAATQSMSMHNNLRVAFADPRGNQLTRPIFCSVKRRPYKAAHGPYLFDEANGMAAFFRQNVHDELILTVRHANETDRTANALKLRLAKVVSKLAFWLDPILLFEKNAAHYEESARYVFERLIDDGREDAWFLLREDMQKTQNPRYRRYMITPHSLKHYVYYFKCRRFIGTEALSHAMEPRCQDFHVQQKQSSPDNQYVFLQHGVMMMVSLDCPQRDPFRRRGIGGHPHVVVSSEAEAQHFVELGGFERSELIKSGLPKFDHSHLHTNADKIVIMPTWRSWEFTAMHTDPEQTGYARMIKRLVDAVPKHLREKVIVIPHPLFNASTYTSDRGRMVVPDSYDVLLRDAKVLITDYSSIAYDAFYRGSNVLFYWEELDECMEHYGKPTHLMLDENTAFGPVCWTPEDVTHHIEEAYRSGQDPDYVARYRKLVEFHDNKNTDRLVSSIKELGII